MKKITVLLSLLCCASAITAQRHEILDRQLHTLQVVVNDDPLLPPIMNLGGGNHLEIGFDEFSHEYHRYIYKVEHCNADWSPSTEIFESDYMNGFNGGTDRRLREKLQYDRALHPLLATDSERKHFAQVVRQL